MSENQRVEVCDARFGLERKKYAPGEESVFRAHTLGFLINQKFLKIFMEYLNSSAKFAHSQINESEARPSKPGSEKSIWIS